MMILPKQAGVALGLLAFSVAAFVGVFSGVTLEIVILRSGIAFLIFLVFGWLVAYIIGEEKKPELETDEVHIGQEMAAQTPEGTVNTQDAKSNIADEIESHGLKPPDDSDF